MYLLTLSIWLFEYEKAPKPSRPIEMTVNPSVLIYKIRRASFNVPNQIGDGYRWLKSDKKMRMIWHAKYRQQFLTPFCNDSSYVFVEFFTVCG